MIKLLPSRFAEAVPQQIACEVLVNFEHGVW
jgi:hypothetical protein